MIDKVRIATPEEVAAVASQADLTPTSAVLRHGPDWAVVSTKTCVDPLIAENIVRRARFADHIGTWLRLNGGTHFYFQVDADDVKWQEQLERWGAERTTPRPQYEYKVTL